MNKIVVFLGILSEWIPKKAIICLYLWHETGRGHIEREEIEGFEPG